MDENGAFTFHTDESDCGKRLDVVVAEYLPQCSRSMAADMIRRKLVVVCGGIRKSGYRVKINEEISGRIPEPAPIDCDPEPIPLDIRYEDDHLLVINKQPGIVVHPAPGHDRGTLVNAVLFHCPEIMAQGDIRPGIVHRLDKDTSGTLVIAKTISAHHHLSRQFKTREIQKTYLAFVHGQPTERQGVITRPIGRHPVDRKKMSAMEGIRGRSAETRWRLREGFEQAALLEIDLKTGRTHQIRVHCAAMGHPVVGDKVYGGRTKRIKKGGKTDNITARRQMLHAWRLSFTHPENGETLTVKSPMPEDMQNLLVECRHGASAKE